MTRFTKSEHEWVRDTAVFMCNLIRTGGNYAWNPLFRGPFTTLDVDSSKFLQMLASEYPDDTFGD